MSEAKNKQQAIIEFDPKIIFGSGFSLGSVDVIAGGRFGEIVGRIIACLMLGAFDENGEQPFSGITVVLPPAAASKLQDKDVMDAIFEGTIAIRGTPPDAEERTILQRVTKVLRCSSLESSDLVDLVASAGARRLIAVVDAGRYRSADVEQPLSTGLTSVRVDEDRWVPQVTWLARCIVDAVKRSESYAFIQIEETAPVKSANLELLNGVDDCYVTTVTTVGNSIESRVTENAERWVAMAVAGKYDEAALEIQSLGLNVSESRKILIQVLNRAKKFDEMLALIEQVAPEFSALPPAQRVQLAKFALRASRADLAKTILSFGLDGLNDEAGLETALDCAMQLEDGSLVETAYNKLVRLLPNSTVAHENRDARVMLKCIALSEEDANRWSNIGFSEPHRLILEMLGSGADYNSLLKQVHEKYPDVLELTLICCAFHARANGRNRDAADIATLLSDSIRYDRQAARITLMSLQQLMLKEEIASEELDYYRRPLMTVVKYLARHPNDASMRSTLTGVLSVESCGDIGLPIIALLAIDTAQQGAKLSQPTSASAELVDEDELRDFFKAALSWLSSQVVAEFGVTRLPADIIGETPDRLVASLVRLILNTCSMSGEDVDINFMEKLVLVTCALTPYAKQGRNEDLHVMRLLAGQLTLAGQGQRARDIAEQILLMGGGDEVRNRLAWAAFADIYHRTRNPVDALVGISCAMATNAPVAADDLWQEVYTLTRILRDLGLTGLARPLLSPMKELLAKLGGNAETDPRIATTELSLRLIDVKDDIEQLKQLTNDMAINCKRLLRRRDELLPAAVLLAQTIFRCDVAGLPVEDEFRRLLKSALDELGPSTAQLITTISTVAPSRHQIVELYNSIQLARDAQDTVSDLTVVTMGARRLLGGQGSAPTPVDCALAIELLAERGVEIPSTLAALDGDWPFRFATELSQNGLPVALIGLDESHELVVLCILGGEAKLVPQSKHDETFGKRLIKWSAKYPKHYGLIPRDHGNNEFYVTMEELDIRLPKADKLLVIAEPLLQQVPLNLVLESQEFLDTECNTYPAPSFLGKECAIGTAPSLSWLASVRRTRRKHNGKNLAWISASDNPEEASTLETVLDRLRYTFDRFEFSVDTSRSLPKSFSGARMVVVTAHGGLTIEGRYIHTIRDEGELVEAPQALASALSDVDLVILFVCSGGRVDKHPLMNTTVSLPKQLLNQGCRTVVASPWPLDSLVTYRWLEPFMEAWEAGDQVLTAVKKANDAVAAALGDPPQYSMAMTAYGDLLLTKD